MRLRSVCITSILVLVTLLGWSRSAPAQCSEWGSGFAIPGPDWEVYVLRVLDDGSGPALYAGGFFTKVDGAPANYVAKWNGSTWSALGEGLETPVIALTVYDDGSGPAIYASGSFWNPAGTHTSGIAKWNGTNWSPIGTGIGGEVLAFAVYDDGSGSALYVGGSFRAVGGTGGPYVAKWNGSTWSSLDGGTNGVVSTFAVFDDGSGSALYAGGSFTAAGSASAKYIAKWDGSAWSPLSGDLGGPGGQVVALLPFDDGSGEALYAGGWFATQNRDMVKRWTGSSWSDVGNLPDMWLLGLAAHDDGAGPKLYACGQGISSGGSEAMDIVSWNGSTWSNYGPADMGLWDPFRVYTLASFDDGSGPALYAGTSTNSNIPSAYPRLFLVRERNSSWTPVGNSNGVAGSYAGGISALLAYNTGTRPLLIAGGYFPTAGDVKVNSIAAWDGSEWTALGEGVKGEIYGLGVVNALAAFDHGPDPGLYAGGYFTKAGGIGANNIARWNGADWGPAGLGTNGPIAALAAYDDGSGPALYAGGDFSIAGGMSASSIAKWDGLSWSALGSGVDGEVNALTVLDDGGGPALFVGGYFQSAGGKSANNIARWNGDYWMPLGSGVNGGVYALTAFHDDNGPLLYAGGLFYPTGQWPPSRVAKWSRASWSYMQDRDATTSTYCSSLAMFDDGSGPTLYAGYSDCCDFGGGYLVKWDGSTLTEVSSFAGGSPHVYALAAFQGESAASPDLYVGGAFEWIEGWWSSFPPSSRLARWTGCGNPGVDFCFGDGSSAACPCENSGTTGHGCENSASTGGALLETSGWTSLNFDSLKLTSSGERPTALTIFLQGASEIAPAPYGDGLRCAGGTLKRFFVKSAIGGVVSAPETSDPSISARSAALGDPLSIGSTRVYQVYYRDPSPTFCPEPLGGLWNASNAVRIGWLP